MAVHWKRKPQKKTRAARANTKRHRKRFKIYRRDGNRCLCCGAVDDLTLDHIVPVSLGGTNRYDNLQTLCKDCNYEKGDEIINYRKDKNAIRYHAGKLHV